MPGLVAFNRRWGIGSDDLVYPGIIDVILRTAWLVVLAIVFSIPHEKPQDDNDILFNIFFIGSLCLHALNIIVAIIIAYTSMQGTVIHVRPRKRMAKLLYIKLALVFPDIAWNSMGTYWGFADSQGYKESVIKTVKGVVIYSWIMWFLTLVGVAIAFDPLGKLSAGRSRANTPRSHAKRQDSGELSVLSRKASKMWECRCRLLCCCATCDEQSNEAFTDISKLLTEYFKDVDLVPTDIAAGLMLLKEEQDSRIDMLHYVPVAGTTTPGHDMTAMCSDDIAHLQVTHLSPDQTPQANVHITKSWMTVKNAAYYMKYASAIYGWPLFVFANPCTGVCRLCTQCRCCSLSTIIQYDNCCQCHAAAIRNVASIKDDDFLYASYHNQIYETPFFVAFDHDEQTIVISIRGTLSLKDALTDLTADCDCLDIPAITGDCLCHRGILQAAKFVKETLENNNVLPAAFSRVANYKLVITGHSLGAGTAALLAILMKPDYPDLICFAFSPPGGLVSENVSEYCSSFIMSVVLGRDVIPRLGIITMEDLKMKLLQTLKDCDKCKFEILATGCLKAICKKNTTGHEHCSQRYLLNNGNNTVNYSASQVNLQEALQNAIMSSSRSQITHYPLYPPGEILYITEETPASSCGGTPSYTVQWSKPEIFNEILVSPSMITDHMPDNVLEALNQLDTHSLSPTHLVVRPAPPNSPNTDGGLTALC